MKRIIGLALAAFLFTVPGAHAQDANRKFSVGALNGTTYTNPYFGITLTFPAGWKALGDDKKQEIADRGAQQLGQNIDEQTQRAAEEALRTTTFNLLTIIKYGKNQQPESNIVVAAERLPQAMTPAAYLGILHDLSKRDRSIVKITDITTETLGKRTFATFSQNVNNGSGIVQQNYYATVDGTYVLAYIMTYTNDAQRNEARRVLESIQYRPGT